ncbi:non-ribosomal peptide synthetase [Nocardia iowensis]|uniref:Amino acid adenylation domain-containing protein n=1 Tax=Nocardia iowensis TaxID=204891 RepID=A0ABX8S049_NOCIO|nr:non-ribosomal peptide synthetase [Nocardia iowensis]QXN94474.1 amino acid adenylation domain-containing protein [Nocardia iowensis]
MFGLSPSQEIVWLHEQMLPSSRAYNFTATLDLWGQLDEQALCAALTGVLDRHPGLRLELVPQDSAGTAPRQRVSEQCVPRIRSVDLSGTDDPETAFEELLRAEAEEPLDTFEAPLLRWCLARLGENHHRLIHVEHHLVHDGRSFAIVLRDLFILYRARVLGVDAELPIPGSYERYVAAMSDPRLRARDVESLAYWKNVLRDAAFDLPLPGLARLGVQRRHAGGQFRQAIGADLAERLRANSRDRGHTPFATLLTLFGELLRRHSGRSDLVVGTAVGNRPDGFEETVGMFVNTIPLRLHLDPVAAAGETVDEVTDTLLRALPHQQLPVQELTRSLGLHTHGADNPLFSVMFSAHDAVLPEIEVPGLEVTLFEGFNTGTTRFDLDLVLLPDDRRTVGLRHGAPGMTLVWDYDRDLFTENNVRLLSGRFLDLLRAYLLAPDAPLAALAAPVLPPTDTAPVEVRPDEVLDPLRRHDPARTAVVDGGRTLTYGELDRGVEALADRLRAAGVTSGAPVAAVLGRGTDTLVTLLACLRMGAVYCPCSPDDPPARLAALLQRLDPALVLTTREGALALPAEGLPVALVGESGWPTARSARLIEGAAYVIHTSGSTGVPKPVVVGRRALAHHVTAVAGRFGLTAEDRVLLFAKPSFDVALEEMLPPLLVGASLIAPRREVPTAPELVAVLAARRVTVANLPTSYLLAARAEVCEALRDGRWSPRLIVLGGERLPVEALREVLDTTDAIVLNAYGLTEATITSTVHEVDRTETALAEVPLGTELPGVRVHVLDAGTYPLPTGAVGELAVQGVGLAEGYLADEAATAARFVTVEALNGERVYLTGDLGYRDESGLLRFLGRRDNQIKLRGYRIEPEEIEAAASAELGGLSCAVVLDTESSTGPRLVGFVERTEVDDRALHAALTRRLPTALVPGHWVCLEPIPMLPGGKPDRRALAALAAAQEEPAQVSDTDAVSDPQVKLIAEGWREVLGHDRFTASSHFFQVGGHSLLAAQLAAWLEPRLGGRPPMRVLFQNPILADQARAVRGTSVIVPETSASEVTA